MRNNTYEARLAEWSSFRQSLESSNDPIQDVIDYYKQVPVVSIHTDPYDMSSWPDPWQLIKENNYCEFTKILAIYYTLKLSEHFSQCRFEIHIVLDEKESSLRYLLFVDNQAIGYYYDKCIDRTELPKLQSQIQHTNLPTY